MNSTRNKHLGLMIFIILLLGVSGTFIYQYVNQVTRLNNQAVELINAGKYDSALSLLDQVLKEDPTHALAHYNRGTCLTEKHRWEEAIQAFEQAIALDPKEANAYFGIGQVLWYENRSDPNKCARAISAFQKALDLEDRLAKSYRTDIWLMLGDCLYEAFLSKTSDPTTEPNQAAQLASQGLGAYQKYLDHRPSPNEQRKVEQKMNILKHPEQYPEVRAKYRDLVKQPTK